MDATDDWAESNAGERDTDKAGKEYSPIGEAYYKFSGHYTGFLSRNDP